MKLYTSMTSPFGHKCRMIAHISGLSDRIEICGADLKSAEFSKLNPLAKVPVLQLDNGTMLADSPVISAYFASLGDEQTGEKTHPQDPDLKWAVLHFEALADGIVDAGILIFMESMRPEDKQSDDWVAKQMKKVTAGLDDLETQITSAGNQVHVGLLSLAAGLSWFDLRNVGGDWREGRPNLAIWFEQFAKHDFWIATTKA